MAATGTVVSQHKLWVFLASYWKRAFINSGFKLSSTENEHLLIPGFKLSFSAIKDYYPVMGGGIIRPSVPLTDHGTVEPVLRNTTPLKNNGLTQTLSTICNVSEKLPYEKYKYN
jgi:hypothetical protein